MSTRSALRLFIRTGVPRRGLCDAGGEKRLHSSEEGPSPTAHTVYSRLDDEQSAQSKHHDGEEDDDDVEESPAKRRRGWFGGLF